MLAKKIVVKQVERGTPIQWISRDGFMTHDQIGRSELSSRFNIHNQRDGEGNAPNGLNELLWLSDASVVGQTFVKKEKEKSIWNGSSLPPLWPVPVLIFPGTSCKVPLPLPLPPVANGASACFVPIQYCAKEERHAGQSETGKGEEREETSAKNMVPIDWS